MIGKDFYLPHRYAVINAKNIGDHVWIGANTFVNFDVPSNSTVKAPKSSCNAHVSKKLESMEKR